WNLERVGGNLRHDRLEALADGRTTDINCVASIRVQHRSRELHRAGSPGLGETADCDSVISAVDNPSIELRFVLPIYFSQTTIKCLAIVAAIELVMRVIGRN